MITGVVHHRRRYDPIACIRCIILVWLSFSATAAENLLGESPLPLPSDAEVQSIRSQLPVLFESQWASSLEGGTAAVSMADMLVKTAETAKAPAEIHTLRKEAMALYVTGGALREAHEQGVYLAQRFPTTTEALWKDTFARVNSGKGMKAADVESLISHVSTMDEDAIATMGVPIFRCIMDGLSSGSRRAGATVTASYAKVRRDVDAVLKQAEQLSAARLTLLEKPDDPTANHVLGRHLLLKNGASDQVMTHLSRSQDSRMAQAAAAYLKHESDRNAQVAVFEQWAGLGSMSDKVLARAALDIAYELGDILLVDAAGLEKARLEKRLRDVQQQQARLAPKDQPSMTSGSGSRVVAHLMRLSVSTPTILKGNIDKDRVLKGLVVFDRESSVQGGVKLTMEPGTVVVYRGEIEPPIPDPTSQEGLPFFVVSNRCSWRGFRDSDDAIENLVLYGSGYFFGNSAARKFSNCAFISDGNKNFGVFEKADYESCSLYRISIMTVQVIDKSQNCLFKDCLMFKETAGGEERKDRLSVSGGTIRLWDVNTGIDKYLAGALYKDEKRLKIEAIPGRPTSFLANDLPGIADALKVIRDKYPPER